MLSGCQLKRRVQIRRAGKGAIGCRNSPAPDKPSKDADGSSTVIDAWRPKQGHEP
jgi:hypothetical protein